MRALLLILALLAGWPAEAGEIVRDPAQVRLFRKLNACPGGADKGSHRRCRGYVVDHVLALDCGGADRPSNMQYQTLAEGRAKDKWERSGPACRHRTRIERSQ